MNIFTNAALLVLFTVTSAFPRYSNQSSQSASQLLQLITSNATLNQTVNIQLASSILGSNCGRWLEDSLTGYDNFTLFLPTDDSLGSLSNLSAFLQFNCSSGSGGANNSSNSNTCAANPFIPFITSGRGTLSSILSCIPQLLQYHLVPGQLFTVSNSTDSSGQQQANVTVLETALNSTAFANLTSSQVLIANSTSNSTFLSFGYIAPANVVLANINVTVNNISGIVHFVDSLLIPPLPLNETLQLANLTDFMKAVDVRQVQDMTDVTVFAPYSGAEIDWTRLVINGTVLYANSTSQVTRNVTNMAGEQTTVQFGNNTVQYGNYSIIYPNILLSNGVLHVVSSESFSDAGGAAADGTMSSSTASTQTSSTSIRTSSSSALPSLFKRVRRAV